MMVRASPCSAACLMAAALVAALAPTAVTSPSGSHKIGFAVPKPLDLKMRRSGGHMAYSVQAMGTSRLLLGRALSPPALAPLHAFMRSAPRGISVAASTAADDVTDEEAMEEVDIDAAIDSELARLNALLTAGGSEGESLSKALKQIECGGKAVVTAGKLEKAIKKKSGAFSSLVEFCVEEGSKQDVEDVSRACRMGKAAAIVIDVGFALDGRGRDTTLQVLAEQAKSKGNFPGPCAVIIRHRGLVDPLQVAEVAALGANAVMIPTAALASNGAAVMAAAAALGLEVVVEVDDADAVAAARVAGARVMCVRGVGSLEEALELRVQIPPDAAALVAIPAQQEQENELEDIAEVKGSGFDGVVLIEAVLEAANDLEYCICILPAIQSKKSSTFAFAAHGTQDGTGKDQPMMAAAQEAQKRNPKAWQKAQREAKQIVGDYKRGVRTLGGDKGSKLP